MRYFEQEGFILLLVHTCRWSLAFLHTVFCGCLSTITWCPVLLKIYFFSSIPIYITENGMHKSPRADMLSISKSMKITVTFYCKQRLFDGVTYYQTFTAWTWPEEKRLILEASFKRKLLTGKETQGATNFLCLTFGGSVQGTVVGVGIRFTRSQVGRIRHGAAMAV